MQWENFKTDGGTAHTGNGMSQWLFDRSLILSIIADKWYLNNPIKTPRVLKFNGQVYTFVKWILWMLKEMQREDTYKITFLKTFVWIYNN